MSYKNNIITLKFSNDKVPQFVEQKQKDWVKYGEENNIISNFKPIVK